jgi:hypothetical protein
MKAFLLLALVVAAVSVASAVAAQNIRNHQVSFPKRKRARVLREVVFVALGGQKGDKLPTKRKGSRRGGAGRDLSAAAVAPSSSLSLPTFFPERSASVSSLPCAVKRPLLEERGRWGRSSHRPCSLPLPLPPTEGRGEGAPPSCPFSCVSLSSLYLSTPLFSSRDPNIC